MADGSQMWLSWVTFDAERWLTDPQCDALQAALLPVATSDHAADVANALRHAEDTCLNTAMLGMVLAYESGRWVNQLQWQEFGPSAKLDAGWPRGLWLPPADLNANAQRVLRERTRHQADVERGIEWAQLQLVEWWQLAAALVPGALVEAIDPAGNIVTETVPADRVGSTDVGTVVLGNPATDDGERTICNAEWEIAAVSEHIQEMQTRTCIFPVEPGTDKCSLHNALAA